MTSSAVSRVLAVTELLENILSHVDSIYDLFVLQRTCRNFQATIRGSTTLRKKMGLAQHTLQVRDETAPDQPADILLDEANPFLYPKTTLRFAPFDRCFSCACNDCLSKTRCKPDEFYVQALQGTEEDRRIPPKDRFWKMRFEHGFSFRFLWRPGRMGKTRRMGAAYGLGFTRDHARLGATFARGSWRSALVCLVPKPVEVGVCVLVRWQICKREGMEGRLAYWDTKIYEKGEVVTLGEVVDFLEEVRGRSYEEHWVSSQEVDQGQVSGTWEGKMDEAEDEFGDEDEEEKPSGDERDSEGRREGPV